MENQEIQFADGIGEITLAGGMVRMDLVTMQGRPTEKDQSPKLAVTGRIVMPPDGFLRSFSAMENLVKQLVDAGLVKPRNQGGSENAGPAGDSGPSEPPKSPNF